MNFVPTLVIISSLAMVKPVVPPADRPVDLRGSMAGAARLAAKAAPLPRAAVYVPPPKHAKGSVLGLVIGGAAGFWVGGYTGYAIEHKVTDGRCYDVCFRGLLIGAPIGALAGAILGWKFF